MKKIVAVILSILFIFLFYTTSYATKEGTTPSGIPITDLENFIDEYMSKYIGKTAPGAAVVVVKDNNIIFSKGYGYADIEGNIPVDSRSTVFEYGSISKLFVYTTIMRLVEQGKIDLNEDIRLYLPENFLKKLKYDKSITLLDVMNHTTGFEDYLFDLILINHENLPTMEQVLINAQPAQVYEPGKVSAYSNYAVALASYIAEDMLGQDFYKYLMDTIFLPLNMNNISAHPTLEDRPELLENKAKGYFPQPNGNFKLGGWSYIPLYPIGGINGTAEDLAQFAKALLPEDGMASPLFEKRKSLDEMFTQTFQMGPGEYGFAHGFIEYDGELRGIGHGGNTAYFSAQMNIVPEDRFGVIILTNAANEMDITLGLTDALMGKKNKTVIAGEGELPDSSLVEGTYIQARRMHNGFLELYSYLSLLKVKAVGPNTIELQLGGETSTLVQTSPFLYERINSSGPILSYNFSPIYFDVVDGQVQKLSGNFLPLPSGRTAPWLVISILSVSIFFVYLLLMFIGLLISKLHRKSTKKLGRTQGLIILFILSGMTIMINNIIIILRMIDNNFRSFSEFRLQILLNYPLAILTGGFAILLIISLKKFDWSIKRKAFSIMTIIVVASFIGTLVNWQFFKLLD